MLDLLILQYLLSEVGFVLSLLLRSRFNSGRMVKESFRRLELQQLLLFHVLFSDVVLGHATTFL